MLNTLNSDFDLNQPLTVMQKVIFINALQAAVKLINPPIKNEITVG